MKRCCRCKTPKPLTEFYNDRRGKDGKARRCKPCAGAVVKKWRVVRQLDPKYTVKERLRHRQYRDQNLEKVRAADRKKMARRRADGRGPKWAYNPYRHRARRTLQRAVKTGKVKRPKRCQECGWKGLVQGHHEDYNKPLKVKWLCSICHGKTRRLSNDVVTLNGNTVKWK